LDFGQKFDFFKIRKNSYMGPFGTSNPEYGGHAIEIQIFGPFLPQTRNFGKTVG
jgi:hypothetical protein